MTGEEIIDAFEGIVDDETIDSTLEYTLLNTAKKIIESSRNWSWLKKRDASNSVKTKLTAMSLPSDCKRVTRLMIEDDTTPYKQVPFESREEYEDYPKKFFIDWEARTFSLCGSLADTKTAYLYYQKKTDDITSDTEPVWPDHHVLLAYEMAKLYYAVDAGEKSRAWDDRWTAYANILYQAMVNDDVENQVQEVENTMNSKNGVSVEDSIKNYID